MRSLTLLCVFFVTCTAIFKTRVFQEQGVAVEPSGIVIQANSHAYIPVTVSLMPSRVATPWASGKSPDGKKLRQTYPLCNSKQINQNSNGHAEPWGRAINETIDEINRKYSDTVDTKLYQTLINILCEEQSEICEKPRREKRFLGVLLSGIMGLGGLGFGIANGIHLGNLDNKVDAINTQMNKLASNEHLLEEEFVITRHNEEKVLTFVHSEMQSIHDTMEREYCDFLIWSKAIYKDLSLHRFMSGLEEKTLGVLEALRSNDLSPHLLSTPQLVQLLKSDKELKHSLYNYQVGLMRKTSVVYPVRVDLAKLLFSFIVEIPVVRKQELVPFFSVSNLGWLKEDTLLKIDLPRYTVYDQQRAMYMTLLSEQCMDMPGLLVCPPDSFRSDPQSRCLSGLSLKKQVEDVCSVIQTTAFDETVISSIRSGALIRTNESRITIIRKFREAHRGYGDHVGVPPNGVIYINHTDYQLITVGSQFLRSNLRMPVRFSVDYKTVFYNPDLPVFGFPTDVSIPRLEDYNSRLQEISPIRFAYHGTFLTGFLDILPLINLGVILLFSAKLIYHRWIQPLRQKRARRERQLADYSVKYIADDS